jgi:hypothetical protein
MQILGGGAKALAVLTTDQEYINRFRTRPRTYRQSLLHGLQSAGVGFYEGAIGILKEPVIRWQACHTFAEYPLTVLGQFFLVTKL